MAGILLAEDNPAAVLMVRFALPEQQLDCDLCVMDDGEEAIAFIDVLERDTTSLGLDLCLLNLHLPKYDGLAVLRHIRASERNGHIPVIVLTPARLSPLTE